MHCVQLLGATAYPSARFGAGAGPIVMNEVRCRATERRLTDCPFSLNHDCGHSQDAGVRCTSSTYGKICDSTQMGTATKRVFRYTLELRN